ncbi:MAG: EAL domain-containing protein [Candidatus Contendobacter sp.]|jgi:diguanylate cyclase (GGDEF)-like protein|nr:EAL domain-containing protein [Candidatus Contendobacter sp.]
MNRERILAILYDLALTLSSEVRLLPLLTRTLQRLLYHTSFPAGAVFLDLPLGPGDIDVELHAVIGDFELARLTGQSLRLPSDLLRGGTEIVQDATLLDHLPISHRRYRCGLRLAMPQTGVILLLTPALPDIDLPFTQVFQPVMANLAKAVLLCRNNEAYTRSLESDRDRATEELRESEQQLHALFNNMADGAALHHRLPNPADQPVDYRVIQCNPRFEQIFNLPPGSATGQRASELYAGDKASFLSLFQEVAATGQTQQAELYFPSLEKYLDISIAPWDRNGCAAVCSDVTERRRIQERLQWAANFDALTQLPNRTLLADRLRQAVAHAGRTQTLLAVTYLDMDGFKPINDRYGRDAGDRLLIEIARRLRDDLRTDDTVARLGGDEFVLLLSDLDNLKQAEATLERILLKITEPFLIPPYPAIELSASIGVSLFPTDDNDPDALLRNADQAMYVAKQTGRHRYHLFDPAQDRQQQVRREAMDTIEAALKAGQFRLYYQPKVDMRRGKVIGAEALIRWQHPERGVLAPGEFLPLVENTALDVRIGDWVIKTALDHLEAWQAADLPLVISVNTSAAQLQQPDFAARLAGQIRAHPTVPPQALELEVVESAALQDILAVSSLIRECQRFGVAFALDDFGTGYSSLTYLKRLPAETLKIDQSFVRDMLHDPEDLAIVSGVIGLARSFQRQVIAEGVESAEHGVLLLELGCDLAQGYGIAQPMPAADLPGWVASYQPPTVWMDAAGSE